MLEYLSFPGIPPRKAKSKLLKKMLPRLKFYYKLIQIISQLKRLSPYLRCLSEPELDCTIFV